MGTTTRPPLDEVLAECDLDESRRGQEESIEDSSIGLDGLLEFTDGYRLLDSVSVVLDTPRTEQERRNARLGEEASIADRIESGAVGVDPRLASGGKGDLHDLGIGIDRRTGTEELPFVFDIDRIAVETNVLDSLCELLVEDSGPRSGSGRVRQSRAAVALSGTTLCARPSSISVY